MQGELWRDGFTGVAPKFRWNKGGPGARHFPARRSSWYSIRIVRASMVESRQHKENMRTDIRGDASHSLGLRAIALFEAAKSLVVLLAGFGLLFLIDRDVQAIAERFIAHLHLNPASRYPRIFLQVATRTTSGHLQLLALGALIYSALRLVEAAGLWRANRWAEWLGVGRGLIYVPFEVLALVRRPGPEPLLALVVNLGVVLFLTIQLREGDRPGRQLITSPARP